MFKKAKVPVCPTKKYSNAVPGTARKQNPKLTRGAWLGGFGTPSTNATSDIYVELGGGGRYR